ncbi:mannose-P-dolichol utilization defect 1 protein [Amylocystis lapponica]|nr:mannose-P-dolichol utilization defect 1 protein [Amylocystis lapponica]
MTAITRNLPWFIKDLGVSIVGQKCYTSLVENLDIQDVECIKYSLSKGLGVGIVVGGAIMKVPQLMLIVSARSARGLSLPAYVLETIAYAITLAYSYRNEFPFSTYGENLFLVIQNAVITLLIIHYPSRTLTRTTSTALQVALAAVLMILSSLALVFLPPVALAPLQFATLPLSLFSKLPQIRQNHRAKSTGQLSAFAVVAQIGGCLARLFTTATEVDDPLVSAGFALALVLNAVVGAQMWMYWGRDELVHAPATTIGVPVDEKEKMQWQNDARPVEVIVPPQSPTPRPSGRKWARKVD